SRSLSFLRKEDQRAASVALLSPEINLRRSFWTDQNRALSLLLQLKLLEETIPFILKCVFLDDFAKNVHVQLSGVHQHRDSDVIFKPAGSQQFRGQTFRGKDSRFRVAILGASRIYESFLLCTL